MRAFVALDLPFVFRQSLSAMSKELASMLHGRFVPAENYHVTLAFLGDVPQRDVSAAARALDAACAGAGAIELVPSALGTFGRPIDATLWMGLERTPRLLELADDVRRELDDAGIAYDGKEFAPHVTLARRARILQDALPRVELDASEPAVQVSLFESVLGEGGATYRPVHRVDLRG